MELNEIKENSAPSNIIEIKEDGSEEQYVKLFGDFFDADGNKSPWVMMEIKDLIKLVAESHSKFVWRSL